MTIHVRSRQIRIDQGLRERIERRVRSALGRLVPRIRRASVRIDDLNGPRGGRDKACRVEVQLGTGRAVFAEGRDADLHASVDRALRRAGRCVLRALKREPAPGPRAVAAERWPGFHGPDDADEPLAARGR